MAGNFDKRINEISQSLLEYTIDKEKVGKEVSKFAHETGEEMADTSWVRRAGMAISPFNRKANNAKRAVHTAHQRYIQKLGTVAPKWFEARSKVLDQIAADLDSVS